MTVAMAAVTVALTPDVAAAAPKPWAEVSLQGKAAHRPTLDAIKADAAKRGIPLKRALDAYIANAAKKMRASKSLAKAEEPDGPVSLPPVRIDDLSAAEIHDLNLIGKGDGKILAATIDAHGWQNKSSDITKTFASNYPGQFTGAVKAKDGSSAWFGFKG